MNDNEFKELVVNDLHDLKTRVGSIEKEVLCHYKKVAEMPEPRTQKILMALVSSGTVAAVITAIFI